ncbi:MAG: radical SAM protein [Deltaproteobacteria bacterium]|nr:MAG: radical SAM protein [Deltaproteobacteria bacterium]
MVSALRSHPRSVGPIDRLRFAPFLVQMVVVRRCNLSCGYCNEYDGASPPVPTEDLEARLRSVRRLGAFSVEFTGGEPMLHPDVVHLVRYARSLGIPRVRMISNAYLLNADRVRALSDAGLDHLQISVDGVEPNDVTVKVLRPLRPKLRAVAEHARFRVTLSAVVGAAPLEEVREVVRFAREHGFRPRVLLLHGEDGQLALDEETLRAYADLQRDLSALYREAGDYRARLARGRPAPFKCRAGARYLYVDEFGNVHWCSQQRSHLSKPLEAYTVDDLVEQFYTPKPCNPQCTLGCARSSSKVDRWRPQSATPPRPPEGAAASPDVAADRLRRGG